MTKMQFVTNFLKVGYINICVGQCTEGWGGVPVIVRGGFQQGWWFVEGLKLGPY